MHQPSGEPELVTDEQRMRRDVADATRRLWIAAAVAFLIGLAGFAATYLPAYEVTIDGATRVYDDRSSSDPVSFNATFSTFEIVQMNQAALADGAQTMPGMAAATPETIGGVPAGHVGLLLAVGVFLVGVALRFTPVQFATLPVAVWAVRHMTSFRQFVEDPFTSGGFLTGPLIGVTLHTVAAFSLMTIVTLSAIQTLIVNQRERGLAKQTARARGEKPEGTTLDLMGAVLAGYLSRYMQVPTPVDEDEEEDEDERSTARP